MAPCLAVPCPVSAIVALIMCCWDPMAVGWRAPKGSKHYRRKYQIYQHVLRSPLLYEHGISTCQARYQRVEPWNVAVTRKIWFGLIWRSGMLYILMVKLRIFGFHVTHHQEMPRYNRFDAHDCWSTSPFLCITVLEAVERITFKLVVTDLPFWSLVTLW